MLSPRSFRLLPTVCCTLLLGGLLPFGPARDGVAAQEPAYYAARQPAGLVASDGRSGFAIREGVLLIPPSLLHEQDAPPVVIETVTVEGGVRPARGSMVLRPGERDVEIGYTALASSRPEDVRFRYMLEGYDEAWKEAGDSRTATYTNLPPGRYTFRVVAGVGGAWSEAGASMTLERRPYFWENTGFLVLAGLVFLLAGPLLYRYQVRRLRRRAETLERLVAQREHAERAAREGKTRTETILKTTADAIITIDERGRIETFNQAAERTFGYASAEVIGRNVSVLMPPPHRKQHDAYLQRYRQTGQRTIIGRAREVKGLRKDGTVFSLDLAVSEARLDDGRRFFTAVLRDITERKRAEAALQRHRDHLEELVEERTAQIRAHETQLEEQADELRRASELKSRFLANISHEFRTPLTLTFGPLKDLLSGRYHVDEEARPLLLGARRNGQRLLRLINQLLDLSRLDAGVLDLRTGRYDLAAFLRQRLAAFESLATARGLALHFVSDTEPLLHVFDAGRLETIILNLLSNAFKFTLRGGSVVVAVRKNEADEAILTVRDTGLGIPSEHLPHLFDRFYQVDSSTTRAREGTGIGLALVKQLVDLHGGRIAVESTVGVGSAFTVTLPLLAPAEAAPALALPEATERRAAEAVLADLAAFGRSDVKTASDEAIPAEATVVLVVEDNADMRAYLRAHLGALYHVEEAEDGAAGLERAVALVPDLILSDVMMPELDGFGLLAALKADVRTSHVPVVLLTARADAESKIAGLETGADDYLAKPFHAEELRARVKNLIEGRRRLWEQYSRSALAMHPSASALPSVEAAFLEQVREVLEAHMGEASFSVEWLAEEVGMSRRQLYRKLHGLLGEQPGALIRRMRMERAAMLLQEGAGSVKEISYRVGFRSASQFRKAFREHYGVAPSDYAEQQRT